ncbi:MAG: hypothetical protein ACSHXA_15615 [Polaribacter sp.]|uniref:hypothetical protein n=1 Tax=Polaribacter sp. TaxID=1920175 RepID=UPI003EF32FA8
MKNLKIKHLFYATITAFMFYSCASPIEIYEKSGHAITMKQSHILYENYNENLKPIIEKTQNSILQREGYEGTEYVLVSIQQLENYIRFLKEVEKTNKGNENNKVTGIAIFLGAHDKTKTLSSMPKFNHNIKSFEEMNEKNDRLVGDMRHRETVFLAPTFRENHKDSIFTNEFQRHIPFFIEYTDQNNKYKGTYKYLLPYLRNKKTESATKSLEKNSSLNADEFNIMPPKS